MNVSDPIDVAELAKSKAISHDVGASEKHPHQSEEFIEPAPVTQVTPSAPGAEEDPLQKVFPSDEDLRTLRRVAGSLPWTTFTVAFVELCERFSYYGTTAVCTLSVRPDARSS